MVLLYTCLWNHLFLMKKALPDFMMTLQQLNDKDITCLRIYPIKQLEFRNNNVPSSKLYPLRVISH
jgi:hypothetical protein